MNRCIIVGLLMTVVAHLAVVGQSHKQFQLPSGSDSRFVEPGSVWVKLKLPYKDIFRTRSAYAKAASTINALAVKPLLDPKAASKAMTNRVAPRNPHIDLALYYQLNFDKTRAVDEYIDELKATGYFEVIEPVYAIAPFFTPNDPSASQQYYLDLINAKEAWDITKGDASMVIAIIDTGGDLDHPDLQANIYIDPAEPIDGIDNDNDGYIDNNRGWDFSGADAAIIGTPGFEGDNDPSISSGAGLFYHGTMVSGLASASTDNGIGIAGTGYKTKLMFTKHYADNQGTSTNYSSNLYLGVLYAATHGAKIINCSWGSYNPSTIAQDIISHVTLDLGCLVIAAAGNSNLETPMYPASYDYVVSVASSDMNDIRAPYSNFGKTVDITAPGRFIYTTTYNDAYATDSGTSLAAPIVSGAAALVWSYNPSYTPLQVAEQLRISADKNIYTQNPAYLNKLGGGRLDIANALALKSPSIRASNQLLKSANGELPLAGESADLYFDFTNSLQASSEALKVVLTSNSPYLTIAKGEFQLGIMQTNAKIRNTSSPFKVTLSGSLPLDQPVEALLTFTDGGYSDTQLITFTLPSYLDVNENNIITSITSAGRIGFSNLTTHSGGSGFLYDEQGLLYEMGLIMGTSSTTLFNNVRGTGGTYDQDFTSASRIAKATPGERSYSEIKGNFINAPTPGSSSLEVLYRSMVWKDDPYRDFVILEYKVKNTTASPLSDFYFGMFADWDVSTDGSTDRAGWNAETKLGYVYPAQAANLQHTGIQVLTGNAQYYAIDNDQTISGNPFGLYDDFTDVEKFTTISSGIARTQAGNPTTGNDVSHVVASGPYTIAAGGEITLAFALHAASGNPALIRSAQYADSVYNYTLKAPLPVVASTEACYGTPAVIHATGATKFNWYKNLVGGTPVFSGPTFTSSDLYEDTVFYVSNADKHYESLRSTVPVSIRANPTISITGDLEFCEGGTVFLSVDEADEYTWSNGAKTQNITTGTSGDYSVTVINNSLACSATDIVTVTVFPKPDASFTLSTTVPSPDEPIIFSAKDADDVSWSWDFGDGSVSAEQNPQHTYNAVGNYAITLTTTSLPGCHDSTTKSVGIVTDAEVGIANNVSVYPNPLNREKLMLALPDNETEAEIQLLNAQGKRVLTQRLLGSGQHSLDLSACANGIYILDIVTSRGNGKKKIIIAR